MFVCAHPAIDPAARTPLMLQAVLGVTADRIADAFALPAPTLAQRLTRAKRRIKDAKIPLRVPDRPTLSSRLPAVLEAIYGAYAIGWREPLATEAQDLAATLAALLPDEPEALGLAALTTLSASRSAARTAPTHAYIPLDEQDPAAWDKRLIAQGEAFLLRAHALSRPGRFQLEAAIQSVHHRRAETGATDWEAAALLYEGLVRIAPTVGALVGRAAAVAEARGAQTGVDLLDELPPEPVTSYQPYWAVRAHLLARLDRHQEAAHAFDRAIGLSEDPAMRAFLIGRAEAADAA